MRIAIPPPEGMTPDHAAKSVVDGLKVTTRLYPGHCLDVLEVMDDTSIHLVVTDPPYGLDGLNSEWKKGMGGKRGTGAIGGLPVGMKFDPNQGRQLQAFLDPINAHLFRVLKPGGFLLMFSAPRLVHRMTVSAEDAGFEIRDQFAWRFTKRAQFKAFSMDHFIRQQTDMKECDKQDMIKYMNGRKTPQLRPQFEAIMCAQKPRTGTFLNNWLEHETGLVDSKQTLTGRAPSTVMTVEKPDKAKYNGHLTVKPVRLMEHLIRLFSCQGQIVLDPFLGSGTTCVAARKAKRHSIGIDINPDYIQLAKRRIEDETT